MKQYLVPFICGIIFTTLIAAGTVSIMTVKPAKPVLTTAITISQYQASSWILGRVKEGYQLHTMVAAGENYQSLYNPVTIVMVKY